MYERSRYTLLQFAQMKNVIVNYTFRDKSKFIISTEIVSQLIDEMRQERKILMALDDEIIDLYIHQDMSDVNIYIPEEVEK